MTEVKHLTTDELHAGLDHIQQSPQDGGKLKLIVRRAAVDERQELPEGHLDLAVGLVGDNWKARGSKSTADGSANPEAQLTIMNARAASLVAQSAERWALAGDQLYLDMDISMDNLPAGARLAIGEAVLEVSAVPHTGCQKFVARFGAEAMKFVNSPVGKQLRLRGVNLKVIQPGVIRVGDKATKVP